MFLTFSPYSMVNMRCGNLRCGGWTRLDQDDVLGPPIQREDELFNQVLISCLSHRLYSKGRVLGHKRGKRNTRPNTSLLQIEGVSTKEDAQFYLGKVSTLANNSSWFSVLNCGIRTACSIRIPCQAANRRIECSRYLGVRCCSSPYVAPSLMVL